MYIFWQCFYCKSVWQVTLNTKYQPILCIRTHSESFPKLSNVRHVYMLTLLYFDIVSTVKVCDKWHWTLNINQLCVLEPILSLFQNCQMWVKLPVVVLCTDKGVHSTSGTFCDLVYLAYELQPKTLKIAEIDCFESFVLVWCLYQV